MSTARFSKSLTSVSANNIVTLLDLPQELAYYEQFKADNIVDHSIVLEDLQCKVGLFSLLEADWPNENALASESAMEAARAKILKEGQKIYLELYIAKGNGPWELQGEEILQNKNGLEQPWALMAPWFSTNETALLGENLRIGVRIANKAQGTGGLKGSDYLRIFGTWRKQTKIESKKKDDGIEALHDRISALETLLSVYGAPSANLPGTNGLVPAPPAGSGEFLLRGDRTWQNPTFVKTNENQTITKNITFDGGILTILGGAGRFVLQVLTNTYNTFRYIASNNSYWDLGIAPTGFDNDFYISSGAAGGGVNGFRLNALNYDLLSSGNLNVIKSIVAGAAMIPSSPPANNWGIDFSQGGSTISLPANSTYDLATGSGMIAIYDNANGNFILAMCAAGVVGSIASTSSGSLVASTPVAGKVGLFYNAGTGKYRILNSMTDTRTLIISSFKMRAAS